MTLTQSQQTAEDWYKIGNELYNNSKYDAAIEAFDEAIRQDSEFAMAWNDKSCAFFRQGKCDEAIKAIDEAIKSETKVQNRRISVENKKLDHDDYENNAFRIVGIDSTTYPTVKASVLINKLCAIAGNLKKEDFKVEEDNIEVAINDFFFTGNASGQTLDLAIVFDETTSMENEIDALKSKIKDLTLEIDSSKFDARYSLITFKGTDVFTKVNWTNDVDYFRDTINKLSVSAGNTELPENSIDGIEQVLSIGFRPDAQKIIIVVTDEPSQQKGDGKSNSSYTMEDVRDDILDSGAMLIAISPDFRNPNVDPNVPRSDLQKYADIRTLANEANGLWIDIRTADFSTILEKVHGILTSIYTIEYISPDRTRSDLRNVSITVDSPVCKGGNALISYSPAGSKTTCNDSDLAQILHNKGAILAECGRNDDAIKALDEAIKLNPKDADAWRMKGDVFFVMGKYDESLNSHDEAISLDPNFAVAWASKGAALEKIGKLDESIEACDKAIRINPGLSLAWHNRGIALNRLGEYEEAIKAFNEAIRLGQGDPHIATSWMNKARSLRALGKVDEADIAFANAKDMGYTFGW